MDEKVQILAIRGKLIVRPFPPQCEKTPATPRIAEARLAEPERYI